MTVDPHELPAELAASLLEKQDKHTRGPLPPATEEILKILAEECGETVQRVAKILRFGFRSNPWNGKDNREQLELEAGDILAALTILHLFCDVDLDRIRKHANRKLQALKIDDGRLLVARESLVGCGDVEVGVTLRKKTTP